MAKKSSVLPRKINVKGQDYKIIQISRKEDVKGYSENTGWTDTTEKVIAIATDQSKKAIKQVLIHEMIHACFAEVGVHSAQLPRELEEVIAESLASMFTKHFNIRLK